MGLSLLIEKKELYKILLKKKDKRKTSHIKNKREKKI